MIWSTIAGLDATKPVLDRVFQDVFNMALSTLALGTALFFFRLVERAWYGLAEVGFGLGTAAYVGWHPVDGTLPRLIAMAGAVYIVVRGMDNINIGRTSDRPGAFALWVNGQLFRNSPEPVLAQTEKPSSHEGPKPPGPPAS